MRNIIAGLLGFAGFEHRQSDGDTHFKLSLLSSFFSSFLPRLSKLFLHVGQHHISLLPFQAEVQSIVDLRTFLLHQYSQVSPQMIRRQLPLFVRQTEEKYPQPLRSLQKTLRLRGIRQVEERA